MAWILWNLFLAIIPVALAAAAAAIARAICRGASAWLWLLLAPLLIGWLAFLPNSCYLFTEPRHFLAAIDRRGLWDRAHVDPYARAELLMRAAVGLTYTAAGALTFVLSIRPLRGVAREAGIPLIVLEPIFFILISVGVYLGLIRRYNSWDLVARPEEVLAAAVAIPERPRLAVAILLFAFILWLGFTISDIWIDGFAARWDRWTSRRAAPA